MDASGHSTATNSTRFTELVGCQLPLQLAGMAGLSTVDLAAAVSNAGGLGMLALPMATPDALTTALQSLRAATAEPFGVTFIVPFLNPECIPVASRHANVVEFSFGPPSASHIATAHENRSVVGWQVGTAIEARAAVDAGADFVIAQGTEAGGHQVATTPLASALAAICDVVDVPVVAAGGIATHTDVQTALGSGAAAVRVGTRFAVASEADIHADYAAALADATAADTTITETFEVFWPDTPHRVLTSSVAAVLAEPAETIGQVTVDGVATAVPTRSPLLPTSTFVGNAAAAPLYAGTSVDHTNRRQPAAEIVGELMAIEAPAVPLEPEHCTGHTGGRPRRTFP